MSGIDEVDKDSKRSKLPAIEGSNPDITIHAESEENVEPNLNKTSEDNQGTTEHGEHQICDNKTDLSVNANGNIGGGCALNNSSHENEIHETRVLKKQENITVEGTCETASSTDRVAGGEVNSRTTVNQVVMETKRGDQIVESVELMSKIHRNNNVDKSENSGRNSVDGDSKPDQSRKQLTKQTSIHEAPSVGSKLPLKRQFSVAEAEAEAMVEKAEGQVSGIGRYFEQNYHEPLF